MKELNLPVSLVEGDEETVFLKTALEDMKKARARSQQKQKGGRFRGGFRGNDRKRRNDETKDGAKPAKQSKTDESNGNNVAVVAAVE